MNYELRKRGKIIWLVFTFIILNSLFLIPSVSHAQLTLAPKCDPALPPTAPGACNIAAFITWIRQIIQFLLIIAIPIGVIFIVYGGFVIMTAGGSEEKVKSGRKIITASVIGVAIAFGAWLIITTINRILTLGTP
jgi:hypothetical protein